MIPAKDQLPEESHYSHLARFLRSGETLEIGEDFSTGAFLCSAMRHPKQQG